MSAAVPVIEARDLVVGIGNRNVCRDLNFVLNAGERLAVLGQNGAGKSTLLSVLAGLREAQSGQVLLRGATYAQLRPRKSALIRGWLGQQAVDTFASTVLDAVLVGRHPHLARWDWESKDDTEIARRALATVGMGDFERRDLRSLSGGERQRVAIATLLAQAPQLYLLDEPTTHLDLRHQIETLRLFESHGGERVASIMVLHEPGLALRFCSRALLLFGDGSVAHGTCQEVLTSGALTKLYGYPMREIGDGLHRWFIPC
ncbi:MAG: ABC transporter ATP-binding protein [Betaproteobacteria bacterium]|nr:ABC transporter ATP-binding protein [Betaproteobacteria bacterium]